jgi:hypothetical protein
VRLPPPADDEAGEDAVRFTRTIVQMGNGEEALEDIFALREVDLAFASPSFLSSHQGNRKGSYMADQCQYNLCTYLSQSIAIFGIFLLANI